MAEESRRDDPRIAQHFNAGSVHQMNRENLEDVGERGWLDLVRGCLEKVADKRLLVRTGDDAAVWSLEGEPIQVVTSDAQVEGTHFSRVWLSWEGLARRAVLAAASDITAMGGTPRGFLLSLGVPGETKLDDLEAFARSLADLAQQYSLLPLGGDTVRSEMVFLDVTVLGTVPEDSIVRQTGSKEGDALWVTGWLGTMRAAWISLVEGNDPATALRSHFWNPPVRWPALPILRDSIPIRAMTDLSDGLAIDLPKMLASAGFGAEVRLDLLPVTHGLREFANSRGWEPTDLAYLGGEDFELLVVEKGDSRSEPALDLGGIPLTRIGKVTTVGSPIRTVRRGVEVAVPGVPFDHYRKQERI